MKEAWIQLQAEEFDLLATATKTKEIEEVNSNYILMAILQQASKSGTHANKAPVYDSDGSAKLGDLKGKSMNTQCASNTLDPFSQELDDENVSLEFQVMSLEKENEHLKTIYQNLFDSIKQTQAQTKIKTDSLQEKLNDTIYENAKVRAQLHGNFFEQNDEMKELSSTRVESTAKTRRPQLRSNTKNDKAPYVSKSSYIKNKEALVEDHSRNLHSLNNQNHMSSECNNMKLAIQNDKSEVVCATCKQCLITANHDVCVFNYVNGMNSYDNYQSANVSNSKNQKKHKPNVKKSKMSSSKERLASPRPRKPRSCLSSSNAQEATKSDFQTLLLFLAGYQNLFIVLRLGLLQAYDQEFKAAHQLRLEVYGNCSLWEWSC
nr:hypothetical protein [Tanacetum cinerariifolium]